MANEFSPSDYESEKEPQGKITFGEALGTLYLSEKHQEMLALLVDKNIDAISFDIFIKIVDSAIEEDEVSGGDEFIPIISIKTAVLGYIVKHELVFEQSIYEKIWSEIRQKYRHKWFFHLDIHFAIVCCLLSVFVR